MGGCLPKLAFSIWYSVKMFDQLKQGGQPWSMQCSSALCNSDIEQLKMPPRKRKKSSTFTQLSKDVTPPVTEPKLQAVSHVMPQEATGRKGVGKSMKLGREARGEKRERKTEVTKREKSGSESIARGKLEPTGTQYTKS